MLEFKAVLNGLNIVGYISVVIMIAASLWVASLYIRGIAPVLMRLAKGLSRRKVAILAEGPTFSSLRNTLGDSKLFKESNILEVGSIAELGRVENCDVIIVHWSAWGSNLTQLLSKKRDRQALIIYAPYSDDRIPSASMIELEQHRNVVVNNFRGRLMNDIVVSLITSGYE